MMNGSSALDARLARMFPAHDDAAEPQSASHARIEQNEDEGAAGSVEWERVWLAAQRSPWSSLALIPIGETIATPRLAASLAEVGRRHLGASVVARDATRVSLSTLKAELAALAEHARREERAIVALPPLLGSPACLELARAAGAALLCVELGSSAIAEAERILDDVGRDHVIGSIIVQKRKERP